MNLFYLIILVTFTNAFAHKIINLIIRLLKYTSNDAAQKQKDLVNILLKELSEISMTEEWAKYAKLQRKINKEKEALQAISKDENDHFSNIKTRITLVFRCILGLILAFILWNHRVDVVAHIDANLLWPLASKLCWSDDPGGITAAAWIIISSTTAKTISKIVG